MDWIQVCVYTSSYGIEPVCGLLYQMGITGLEIEDEADFKAFLENNKDAWDYVDDELIKEKSGETCIKLYIPDTALGYEQLSMIRSGLSALHDDDEEHLLGRLEISTNTINEEDWANNWKQYFKPLKVGEKILICPEWETIPCDTTRSVFIVNPGMSFGTGSHETTQLCIEEIEKYINADQTILDIGCGSGILSIISIILGAKEATAVDIDINAVDIAKSNAQRNGIEENKYNAITGNVINDEDFCKIISKKKYDVVLANIVADVIISLCPIVPQFLKSGGLFITSGIISDRLNDVKNIYESSDFEIMSINQKGDWASITMKKQ